MYLILDLQKKRRKRYVLRNIYFIIIDERLRLVKYDTY